MFADIPPERDNTRGARWNPPETRAIYTSLEKETVLAEANHAIAMQPIPPSTRRTIYSIEIALEEVLDLSDWANLERFGLDKSKLTTSDFSPCQAIGGAVDWLGHDGLLIPSARANGTNLEAVKKVIRPLIWRACGRGARSKRDR